jgi:hypothetical protein
MKHDPYGDHFEASTNELLCAVFGRVDALDSLHTLLALMVEMSDGLSIKKQYLMAGTLHDAATLIQERPGVRDLLDLLALRPEIAPATDETRPA